MIKKYYIFKKSINHVIQNSGLDVGAVYFILKDIFKEIEDLYYTQINTEFQQEAIENSKEDENLPLD